MGASRARSRSRPTRQRGASDHADLHVHDGPGGESAEEVPQAPYPSGGLDVAVREFSLAGYPLPPRGRPMALELCCGSAGLSLELARLGWTAVAVNEVESVVSRLVSHVVADLRLASVQKDLLNLVLHPDLCYVHFAPPCGTASRARDRPVRKALRDKGFPEVPPLRSSAFPLGLPTLQTDLPKQYLHVLAENDVYACCARLAGKLREHSIPWTMENPAGSYMWDIGFVRDLLREDTGDILMDMCMFGSTRLKHTRVRAYPLERFGEMGKLCDGKHRHEAWGVGCRGFATANEKEHPKIFCETLAVHASAAVCLHAPGRPVTDQTSDHAVVIHDRVAAALQPRGRRAPPLLPEYKFTDVLTIRPDEATRVSRLGRKPLDDPLSLSSGVLPAGTRVLQIDLVKGAAGTTARTSSRACSSTSASSPTRITFNAWDPKDPDTIYIARRHRDRQGRVHPTSFFANPFRLADCPSRAVCLSRFRSHLSTLPSYPECLRQLSGKKMVCHCRPDEECHGDVLTEAFVQNFLADDPPAGTLVVKFGVLRSPSEFVDAALALDHPSAPFGSDDAVKLAIARILADGVASTTTRWRALLGHWRARAEALQDRENQLHAAMAPDVRRVLRGKRLLIFKELLDSAGFPGAGDLVHQIAAGFPVVGALPPTGVFPKQPRDQAQSISDLWRTARAMRRAVLSATGPSKDHDLDIDVTDATAKEVEKGWLEGPLLAESLDRDLGLWLPARRFGIRQGDAVRAIDDYSVAGHNAATSVEERVDMGGIDVVASLGRTMLAIDSAGHFVADAVGEPIDVVTHGSFTKGGLEVLGKEWDLAKAYRQLARSPAHRCFTVISTWNARLRRPELYQQPVLAFGAASSVQHFCWAARALCHILVSVFGLVATHYVDNFPVLCYRALRDATQTTIDQLFDILGWDTKEQLDFSPVFTCLGVVFAFNARPDAVQISNKPSRLAELDKQIQDIVSSGRLGRAMARSMRGRLAFCRAQVFGKFGAHVLSALDRVACGAPGGDGGFSAAVAALRWLSRVLSAAPPRVVPCLFPKPLVLFTDGACEPGADGALEASCGAVLFIPGRRGPKYFGARVGQVLLDRWTSLGSKQVVGQAELLPVVLAKWAWAADFKDMPVIEFIDNDSARFGLMSGSSPSPLSTALIAASSASDCLLGSFCWVARVPSWSNVADAPSRMDFRALEAMPGATSSNLVLPSGSTFTWEGVIGQLDLGMGEFES